METLCQIVTTYNFMVEIIFSKNQLIKKGLYTNKDFREKINFFSQKKINKIDNLSIEEIVYICDLISKNWQSKKSKIYEILIKNNLGFLIGWLRSQNLKKNLNINFSEIGSFGGGSNNKKKIAICPKGTIVHWIAGNVPVLGLISLFQGIITKNKNIVKVPKNYKEVLPILLEDICKMHFRIKKKLVNGKILFNSTLIVYAEREDHEAHETLSINSDVRVAWGGKDSIESISKLRKKITCEDIFFGPKVSMGVISKEYLSNIKEIKKISSKIARDVFSFDQLGCNAPHNIYIEKTSNKNLKLLIENLKYDFNKLSNSRRLNNPSELEILNVLTNRIIYSSENNKSAFFQNNFDWSILVDKENKEPSDPVYFRTLFIKTVKDVIEVPKHFPNNIQTIGCLISRKKISKFRKIAINYGALRFANIGEMALYENPWDGILPMSRMVNYIKLEND